MPPRCESELPEFILIQDDVFRPEIHELHRTGRFSSPVLFRVKSLDRACGRLAAFYDLSDKLKRVVVSFGERQWALQPTSLGWVSRETTARGPGQPPKYAHAYVRHEYQKTIEYLRPVHAAMTRALQEADQQAKTRRRTASGGSRSVLESALQRHDPAVFDRLKRLNILSECCGASGKESRQGWQSRPLPLTEIAEIVVRAHTGVSAAAVSEAARRRARRSTISKRRSG